MMTPLCDSHHVGIIARNERGQFVVISTRDPETETGADVALVSGHLDGLDYEQAARHLLVDELGLTVRTLAPVSSVWRPDPCLREPGLAGASGGHYWQLWVAEIHGELSQDTGLGRRATWYSEDGLNHLARATISYANGLLTSGEYAATRRLVPVCVGLLADAHVIDVAREDRAVVEPLVSVLPATLPAGPPYRPATPSSAETWQARIYRVCGYRVEVTAVLAWPAGGGYDVHLKLPEGVTPPQLAGEAGPLELDVATREGVSWSVEAGPGVAPGRAVLHVATIGQDQDDQEGQAPPLDEAAWRAAKQEEVRDELAAVRGELARVDVKAGLLLAFAASLTTAAGAVYLALPNPWSRCAAAGAMVAVVAAAVRLLLAVRPKLPRPGKGVGFVAHAELAEDADARDILDGLSLEQRAHELRFLSRLTRGKHRAVRTAVDLTVTAVIAVLIALAGMWT